MSAEIRREYKERNDSLSRSDVEENPSLPRDTESKVVVVVVACLFLRHFFWYE